MTYQEHYDLAIQNGCTPALADLLASRSFPGTTGTDRAFWQGRQFGGAQFQDQPLVGRHHLRRAEQAGVNVAGKIYNGTLARFPGDPEAWVDSLGDVKKRCEERGWGCEGAITVKPPRYAERPPEPYRVADDLIEKYVDDSLAADPDLAPRRAAVKEELAHKLAGIHGAE